MFGEGWNSPFFILKITFKYNIKYKKNIIQISYDIIKYYSYYSIM